MTHNKLRISVHLANGQFSSFRNEHFFEQTSFEKFEELNPEFFRNCSVVIYVQRHEDKEELRDEDASSQSSFSILMETETDSDNDNDNVLSEAPTRPPIALPLLPLVPLNNANLPFMQTLVANIFIF